MPSGEDNVSKYHAYTLTKILPPTHTPFELSLRWEGNFYSNIFYDYSPVEKVVLCYKVDRLVALLPTFPSVCCLQYDVCAGPAEAVRPIRFSPDHSFTQAKKKKEFLVGFDQCGFTAWQRKSSKYSNAATVTPVLLQRASDNRSSVVLSTGLGVLHCGAGMRSRLRAWFCAHAQHV